MATRKATTPVQKAQPVKKATAKKATTMPNPTSSTNTMANVKESQTPKPSKLNSVGRVGNVGSINELTVSEGGKHWLSFTLAVHPYNPETRKAEEEATWYNCVCFGYLAQHVAQCITPGARVVVCGRGDYDIWTDDEGVEHKQRKIICDGVGADLLFATVEIKKTVTARSNGQSVIDFDDEEEPF